MPPRVGRRGRLGRRRPFKIQRRSVVEVIAKAPWAEARGPLHHGQRARTRAAPPNRAKAGKTVVLRSVRVVTIPVQGARNRVRRFGPGTSDQARLKDHFSRSSNALARTELEGMRGVL